MRFRLLVVLAVLLVGVVPASAVPASAAQQEQAQCSFPYSATDATGANVTVEEEPQRVVALQASTAQIMWEIGAKDKVVGMPVRSYTAYLDGSKERTDVLTDGGMAVDVEQVVKLDPDLVVAPGSIADEQIQQIRDAGIPVYKFASDTSIESIYRQIERVGRLTGECEGAERTVSDMRDRVQLIEGAVEGEERPRVLYTFYGYTAGNGTFIDSVITAAGGQNVAAEAGIQGYAQISEEQVVKQDPEWIVTPNDAPLPNGTAYESTTAFRKNQTVTVNASLMNQAGPRVVQPMTKLAKTFHPEAVEEALASADAANGTNGTDDSAGTNGTDGTNGTNASADATDGNGSGGTGGSGPGFGVAAAVVALVGAALLTLRRT
ncbi:PGF-CTERM-anchored ABC transporter substrate-binding protein [Halomarina pelagica]|uniref:PGF-CTERM-anchored ABC transporter substrate-binding protein n=1 Tax=Halomarina pelagica TaxID=2961599 RepID=UPI0020C25E30|nr:PGF-CTERM-anchored ABC transporter substrate-binding protein [Halomarina sp. BND7]